MALRLLLVGLLTLALTGFATVAFISLHHPAAPDAPAPMVHNMIAAAHELRAGELVKPEDLVARGVGIAAVPAGAIDDTQANRATLFGAMVRRTLEGGDLLLPAAVIRPGDHGFLAAVLAPGMRAATVGVDAVSGGAGLIWPGDHVDLILTQELQDPNLPASRRFAGETVLSDIRVIAIDQHLTEGATSNAPDAVPAQTATLELSPIQAERLAVAVRLGKLALSVRPADAAATGLPEHGGEVTWGGDVSPALARAPAMPATVQGGRAIHVFDGADEGKEVKF